MMAEEQSVEEEQRLIVRSNEIDEVAIVCCSVSLKVGEGETKSNALEDVTGAFVSGKLYGVLGPSGSGKTYLQFAFANHMKCTT